MKRIINKLTLIRCDRLRKEIKAIKERKKIRLGITKKKKKKKR